MPYDDGGGSDDGGATVYRRAPTGWALEASLHAANPPPYARIGGTVALDGNTAVVGGTAVTLVFVRSGTTWTEQATLPTGPLDNSLFNQWAGEAALSGDTLTLARTATIRRRRMRAVQIPLCTRPVRKPSRRSGRHG
jgi:hypothetical protein